MPRREPTLDAAIDDFGGGFFFIVRVHRHPLVFFFFQAEDGIRDYKVTGVQRVLFRSYRDALGVMPPSGLPDVYLEAGEQPLRGLVLRYAKGRGPFTTGAANARFGIDVESVLRELEREELLVR